MSNQVTVLIITGIYLFLKRNSILKLNYAGTFDVSCGISLVLRDCHTDSENVSLIGCSISDVQKTCSSKGVSLMGI